MKNLAAAAVIAALPAQPLPDAGPGYTLMCAASATDRHVETARPCWSRLRFEDAAGCQLAAQSLNTPYDPLHYFCSRVVTNDTEGAR